MVQSCAKTSSGFVKWGIQNSLFDPESQKRIRSEFLKDSDRKSDGNKTVETNMIGQNRSWKFVTTKF